MCVDKYASTSALWRTLLTFKLNITWKLGRILQIVQCENHGFNLGGCGEMSLLEGRQMLGPFLELQPAGGAQ